MAGPIRVKVHVEGIKELRRALRADETLAPPFKAAMEQVAELGLSAGRRSAPRKSGDLSAKLTKAVQAKPMPLWAAIRSKATRSSKRYKRYPYPKRLEYDASLSHAGWLRGAINNAAGQIQGILDRAARSIESRWQA